MKNEEIKLSPIEATAYWWIKVIRNKVREIALTGSRNKSEEKFVEIFYSYSDAEWRNVYLELVKYITEDVNSYIQGRNSNDMNSFSQDTDKSGHDRINSELSKIVNRKIPNIRLANNGSKDSVIYTNMSSAYIWYKSCATRPLSLKYESNYILTGDEKELNFYNSLLSTIFVIKQSDTNFKSIPVLREKFCQEYVIVNDLKDNMEDVLELFNHCYEIACDRDIITGRWYKENYLAYFRDIDLVGLESYMALANHYAEIILEKEKCLKKQY